MMVLVEEEEGRLREALRKAGRPEGTGGGALLGSDQEEEGEEEMGVRLRGAESRPRVCARGEAAAGGWGQGRSQELGAPLGSLIAGGGPLAGM